MLENRTMSFLIEDPLDSEHFDAVQYINQRFPTGSVCIPRVSNYNLLLYTIYVEASLEELDTFISGISGQISQLDEVLL